jgi:tetratricopeptide (TPR) repeat protein
MRTDNKYLLLGIILLITLISYWPVLQNQSFVWDDEGYITNNPVVQSFQLKEIFTANVMGNYHPVTVLVMAVEYFFFGMKATGYHIINLLLHLLNVLLVFYLVVQLSRKTEVALVAALLFGIHPMHVESVAWISGLKDLLYTAFFLGSWIVYLKFLTSTKRKCYFLSLLLFLLSLLSKPMAVTLPVALLLTDFFLCRKMNRSVWLEKVPFFLLSLLFGFLAISTQKSSGNLSLLDFTVPQQWTFASFGFVSYLVKLFFPVKLCAFYPYPVNHPDAFPVIWYGYLAIVIALIILVFYSLRITKTIFFGFGIFAVTLFLVLQWLPVGKAIMADRYSYLPSLAIFFLAAEGFYLLWQKNFKWIAIPILGFFTFLFSLFTFQRSEVWKSEITLWNDVLSKYENVPLAYLNRGIAFAKANEMDKAIEDIGKAIQLDTNYPKAYNNNFAKAYYNRGNMYLNAGKSDMALKDFDKCIELNPGYVQAYFNRGNIHSDNAEYDKALADYSKAIELDPQEAKPYINRGFVYGMIKEYEKALKDFEKADKINPGNPETHFNRGIVYVNMGEYEKAVEAYTESLALNPNDAEAFFNRGYILIMLKKYKEAITDFTKVIELHPDDPRGFYYRGLAEYYSADQQSAVNDLKKASGLGYKPAEDFLRILSE